MMKCIVLAAVAATVAAIAPTISLDLAESAIPNGDQSWTMKCPAGKPTNPNTCPLPTAKAWGLRGQKGDQKIDYIVTTRVYLLDNDGDHVSSAKQLQCTLTSRVGQPIHH